MTLQHDSLKKDTDINILFCFHSKLSLQGSLTTLLFRGYSCLGQKSKLYMLESDRTNNN